uniref:Uncharacterized protein n=1 Tax=Oryza meridionalis TaxID=40149 RepID=A0A0E0DBW0_9ORYZ
MDNASSSTNGDYTLIQEIFMASRAEDEEARRLREQWEREDKRLCKGAEDEERQRANCNQDPCTSSCRTEWYVWVDNFRLSV